VRVLALHPPGHVRTPCYVRGRTGAVVAALGPQPDPQHAAYGGPVPDVPLYRVRFAMPELWPDYAGAAGDTLVADLFANWLEPAEGPRP
jgi:nitrile hydratase